MIISFHENDVNAVNCEKKAVTDELSLDLFCWFCIILLALTRRPMKRRKAVLPLLAFALISCGNLPSTPTLSERTSLDSSSRSLVSLLVLCPPLKREYYEGERLNRSGLKLLAEFSDGTSFSPSNVDIELVEQGSLTLGMTSVHFRYLEKVVEVSISVRPLQLEMLSIASYPITTTYVEKGNYSFTGLEVAGKVKGSNEERTFSSDEYSLSILGNPVHEQDEILLQSGNYEVLVSAFGKSVSFPIRILDGYKIEAEDVLYSSDTTLSAYVRVKNEDDSDYITSPNGHGAIRAISDESAWYASANSYLGDIKSGNVISFFFQSKEELSANINIRASSGYMLASEDWTPRLMGDERVDKLFDAYVNGEKIDIPDDVYLPGGGDKNGDSDPTLWVNWKNTTFTNIKTRKGYNVITLKIKSDYMNCLGYECSFNLDYLSVDFVS